MVEPTPAEFHPAHPAVPASCLCCPAFHKVLVLGATVESERFYRETLAPFELQLEPADSSSQTLDQIHEWRSELALWEVARPDEGFVEQVRRLRQRCPRLPVVVVAAELPAARAIELIKAGAFDVLVGPLAPDRLHHAIERACEDRRHRCKAVLLHSSHSTRHATGTLVGRSPAMQQVLRQIGLVAARSEPVLLVGETGTGKELVAHTLHQHSARRDRPFLALNCAALPEHLLENELFGHEKGAFTGAEGRYCGIFEQAARGTLFLDEISDLPLLLQGKLLRVLQEGEIRRLGGTEVIPVDVRLLAATSDPLETAMQAGRFREDLFFRLNVVTIQLPPLREHAEDIRELAEHFLALYTPPGESPPALDTLALAKLQRHSWPGNIRELENTLRRALVLARGLVILEQDILLGSSAPGPGGARAADLLPCACEEDALDRALRLWLATCTTGTAVNDLEAKLLRATLCHTGSNQVQAARLLGISRSTLREWIKKHQAALPPEGFPARD